MSGAALLREELNSGSAAGGDTSSLLDSLPVEKDKGMMMANFEEWIKMATDNKINTTNSWNFALIDYFHDMDVLRGTDNNINFQKASATLDGCVKIYSSRVDSVATETGRLLSGLATRKDSEPVAGDEEDAEGEEVDSDDDDLGDTASENSKKKKASKSRVRRTGDTLTTFEQLRIKKLSQELNIDPLFKKTLAEFDEGGAKSLLLNTLHIDDHARVVFDASTTNINDIKEEEGDVEGEDVEMSDTRDTEIDLTSLQSILFSDIDDLDQTTLCPSIEHLNSVLKDINRAKSILSGFTEQNANEMTDFRVDDFGDDAPEYGDFDAPGGSAENSVGDLDDEAAAVIFQDELASDQEEVVGNDTGVVASVIDQDLMAYFDNTLKRSWAGPEHWKVRQFKKDKLTMLELPSNGQGVKQKKVKEVFAIDFMTPMDDDEQDKIFAKSKASTLLPQSERDSKDSHLLPDDMYFSSNQLTKLFLKPTQKLNIFRRKVNVRSVEASQESEDTRPVDASFWADNYKERDEGGGDEHAQPDFDNDELDIGGDVVYGDIDFDVGSAGVDERANLSTQLLSGGSKMKPEALNYSRKAKNVNVKQLKDNIWKSLEAKKENGEAAEEMHFSSLVTDIAKMYPTEQKKDLSTSFCFICLLHLANEHSLTIENNGALDDLKVSGLR